MKRFSYIRLFFEIPTMLIRIFTLYVVFFLSSSSFVKSQTFPSGIYTDVAGSDRNLIFYTVNGINYVIQKDYDYYTDDIVIRETLTHGLVRNDLEMNYTCGPFSSYCRDGYFFTKNGKSYYYDELLFAYEALDSLNYLYVKIDELPENWTLNTEDRVGERGIINEEIIYEITKITEIKKINSPKCPDCIYIEGYQPYVMETNKYLIKETDLNKLELAKSPNFELSYLLGKTVQMYFKWEHGRTSGYLIDENLDYEVNKSSVPYDIKLMTESLNANSQFTFPNHPKK